jgi:hypothetical protein
VNGIKESASRLTEARPAMVMANHEHAYATINLTVDQRIGKHPEYKTPAPLFDGRPQIRMIGGESGDALELVQKSLCDNPASLLAVEVRGVDEIMRNVGVQLYPHSASR